MVKPRSESLRRRKWVALTLVVCLVGLLSLMILVTCQPPSPSALDVATAQPSSSAALLDVQRCEDCHAQQVADWLGSHHEQAMQEARPETVLGDFQNAAFNDGAVTSRFFQNEGQFMVNTAGEDGQYADFTVRYTFGITPLQQYLLELPQGRLQAFTVAWDTIEQRWFSLYPGETFEPGDRLHWTSQGWTSATIQRTTAINRRGMLSMSVARRVTWRPSSIVSGHRAQGSQTRHRLMPITVSRSAISRSARRNKWTTAPAVTPGDHRSANRAPMTPPS